MFTKKTVMKTAPLAAMALAGLLTYACSDDDAVGFAIPVVGDSTLPLDMILDNIAGTLGQVQGEIGGALPDFAADIEFDIREAENEGDFPAVAVVGCPTETSTWLDTATEFPATIAYNASSTHAECDVPGADMTMAGNFASTTTGLGGIDDAGPLAADLVDLLVSGTGNGFMLTIIDDGTDRGEYQGGGTGTASGTYDATGNFLISGSSIGGFYDAGWEDATVGFSRATAATAWVFADEENISFTTDVGGTEAVTLNGWFKTTDDTGHYTTTLTDLVIDPNICGGVQPASGEITIGNALGETLIVIPGAGLTYGAADNGGDCGDVDVTYMGDVAATAAESVW